MPSNQWIIGVDPAMICDEWYQDFYIGQIIDFPVAFYSPGPRKYSTPRLDRTYFEPSDESVVHAEIIDNFDYMINGKTIHTSENGWILDIGIRVAARSKATEWEQPAKFVHGRTFLVAEWAETGALTKELSAPPLVYTWRIDRIQMHDEQSSEYTDEQSTNARMDMRLEKHVAYQLTCTKLDIEPKRFTTKYEKLIERNKLLKMKHGIDI